MILRVSAGIIASVAATFALEGLLWTATNRIHDRTGRSEKRMGSVEQGVARVESLCEGHFGESESDGLRRSSNRGECRMNSTRWIAFAAVAVTLTFAATHEAFADSGYATNCQLVADRATGRIDTCWFFAGNDARERRVCSRLEQDARALVRWCNGNINRCKQNYVSWHLEGNSLTGTEWEAHCVYGTR